MRDQLFSDGLSPEVNTLDDFVAYAKAYEAATKTAEHYRAQPHAHRASETPMHLQTSRKPEPQPTKRVYMRSGDLQRGITPQVYASPYQRKDQHK